VIVVYTKPNCPQCDTLKATLARAGIEYDSVDVSLAGEARTFLVSQGHRSVPQMYQDGVHVSAIEHLVLN